MYETLEIENTIRNIRIISEGKKLFDEDEERVLDFVEIVLEDKNLDGFGYTLNQFADLIEYVEPKTREQELEEEVEKLKQQLEALSSITSTIVSSGS